MTENNKFVKKNDFVELTFTAICNNKIFDTTNPKEAEELGIPNLNVKPLIISVGNQMVLKGLDEFLEGKELNQKYSVHLKPEQAFGKRDPNLIKTYSLNNFKKQNLNPFPGMTLQLDNTIARVISVSGGRVTLDFNNPLAGKEVDYEFKINRLITNDEEKINALQDFFFKGRFEFAIKNNKVIFKDPNLEFFLQMLGEKLRSMTGFDFVIEKKSEQEEENRKNDLKTNTEKQQ